MAWLELHQSLPTHRKTLMMADALDVQPAHIVGHLACLWLWALDNAQDGVLQVSPRLVARAAQWEGDPQVFMDALLAAGFLDCDGHIHDWDEYAGRLLEIRRKSVTRARSWREQHATPNVPSIDNAANAHATHNKRVANDAPDLTNQTKPNQTNTTGQDQTNQVAPDADAPDAEPRSKPSEAPLVVVEPVPKPRPRDPVWDTLAAIYGEPMLDGERSARNGICKQFREAARKQGMTVQQMAALIGRAHGNWANVMGGVTETPNGLTKYFTTLLEGPQVNGRSNGTVTAHTQHLRELATVNRGPKRGSAALDDEWRLSDHAQPGGE